MCRDYWWRCQVLGREQRGPVGRWEPITALRLNHEGTHHLVVPALTAGHRARRQGTRRSVPARSLDIRHGQTLLVQLPF